MATDDDLLAEAVRTLYAVPSAEFVATRTARVRSARAAGHRDDAAAISALRKPTAGADAINQVVRAQHAVVTDLRALGERLRQAQSGLDAAGLAALRGPRDDLVAAFGRAVEEVTTRHTPGVLGEVRDTVIAALADAQAQEVVCSGALTRALTYSGFGEVDVSDAVARTSTGVLLTRLDGGRAGAPPRPEQPEEVAGGPDAGPDPAELIRAKEAVAATEARVKRGTEEVAQATRLLTQARSREAGARTAYQQAVDALADLDGRE